jgi:hypothetical protein
MAGRVPADEQGMAKYRQRALIGADIEGILDAHFKEIAAAIPETLDLIERYTMRIARLDSVERVAMVIEFRAQLLELIRTRFTVVLADERRLDQTA